MIYEKDRDAAAYEFDGASWYGRPGMDYFKKGADWCRSYMASEIAEHDKTIHELTSAIDIYEWKLADAASLISDLKDQIKKLKEPKSEKN